MLALEKISLKSKYPLKLKHLLKEKELGDLLPLKVLKMNPLRLEDSIIVSLLNLTSIIYLIKWTLDLIILSTAWITWSMACINYIIIIISIAHGLLLLLLLLKILKMAMMPNVCFHLVYV